MAQENAFQKKIVDKKSSTPIKSKKSSIVGFVEKNGMLLGGASLALGVMMVGGTFFSQNGGLKAELTDSEATPTTTVEGQVASTAESTTTETTTANGTTTASSEIAPVVASTTSATTNAASTTTNTVVNTTSETTSSSSSTTAESTVVYTDPIATAAPVITESLPASLPVAPNPENIPEVPAALIGFVEPQKEANIEVLPAEAISIVLE